jgi:hypothetical protein
MNFKEFNKSKNHLKRFKAVDVENSNETVTFCLHLIVENFVRLSDDPIEESCVKQLGQSITGTDSLQ